MMDDEPRAVEIASPAEPERERMDHGSPGEKAARMARWRAENARSIVAWNAYVEKNGLPLEDYRLF